MKVKARLTIGDLAQATGVTRRALRYYEQQGLLTPDRGPNGYRYYPATAVAQVKRIRTLLAANLSTEAASAVLPCVTADAAFDPCPALTARLNAELEALDERLGALIESRRLLADLVALAHS